MLTMDFGGFYEGYAGDMTRTVVIGEASPKLRYIYHQLLEAQELGVAAINAGVACQEIDRKVRQKLGTFGLDTFFLHGTGHGVGLEIHEIPSLSTSSDAILEENMVVTVEPGVYMPGWGGIRIEDTVIVKNGGCEVITRSDKGLLII
jgi:Xaa-Pro aminopeptidase/Xaa-Pro dipeptidase